MNKKIVFLVFVVLVVLMMGTLAAQEVEVFPVQTSDYWRFDRISQRLLFWQRIGGQVTVYQLPGMEQVDKFAPGIAWVISVQYSPFSNKYYILGGSESANSADTLLVFDVQGGANRRPVQSFQLSRTGFHPLYVDSRSGFAFYSRPSLSSENEKKFLIFNLASGKLEGEVEATPPQQSYWTAFDQETQRLVFHNIGADSVVQGVYVYSTSRRAIEKLLPTPFKFQLSQFVRNSAYDFDGKYIVVPNQNFVLDLEGRSFYDSSKYGWGDSSVVADRSKDFAVAISAIHTTPTSFKSSFVVTDLSLGIPIHRFSGEEAKLETGKFTRDMILQDSVLYYIISSKVVRITLPPYERFDKKLIIPFVRQNDKEWTGLAVMSSDANHLASAQIRNRDGDLMPGLINPVLLNFAGSPQIARFSQEWFGNDVLKQTLNNTQAIVIRYNSKHTLKGFWLSGDNGTYLDGSVALTAKDAGTELVIPFQDGDTQVANSGNRWAAFHIALGEKANVTAKQFDANGFSPGAANWGALNAYQVASSEAPPDPDKKYILVESDQPLVGVALVGRPGEDKAAFLGQPVWARKKKLYFTQNATGVGGVWTTHLVLANRLEKDKAPQVQVARLTLFDNDGRVLATATRSIPGNGFLWETTLSLFGVNDVTGYVIAETQGEGLLGWIRFRGWQLAAALPAQEPAEVLEISHVAQVPPQGSLPGWGHGVTVLNPTNQTIEVRAEVFKPNGEKTGESTFTLNPGEKRAQHLNEPMFFGPAFQQAGGFVRLTVLTLGGKIAGDSLYYNSTGRVMAAVEGQ